MKSDPTWLRNRILTIVPDFCWVTTQDIAEMLDLISGDVVSKNSVDIRTYRLWMDGYLVRRRRPVRSCGDHAKAYEYKLATDLMKEKPRQHDKLAWIEKRYVELEMPYF